MCNRSNTSELRRDLGLFCATMLVVANMIGTGIFTTPGLIMKEVDTPLTVLICWLLGSLFALSGALCYGELGASYPEAGGEYVYLREGFGKWMGFLSGWMSLIVGFSAPIAAASIAFAGYALQTVSVNPDLRLIIPLFGVPILSLSPHTALAIGSILLLCGVHYHGVAFGSRIQNALTLFKIGIIVVFVITGLTMGHGSTAHFSGGLPLTGVFEGRFAVALLFVSFAYSGWNAAAYMGAEIEKPRINLPRALIIGTLLVTVLYLLLNIVFIYALPPEEMEGVVEVGAKSAVALFGPRISIFFSGAISVALLSGLSAMIMTGPRVYYAMSRDGVFFDFPRRVSEARRTPGYSILLQAALAVFMAITASFETLLLYIGFTLCIFAMLAVVSLMRLRIKRAPVPGSYRLPCYPITPLIFIFGNLWIIYFTVRNTPHTAFCGLLTIGIGGLAYLLFHHRSKRNEEPETRSDSKGAAD